MKCLQLCLKPPAPSIARGVMILFNKSIQLGEVPNECEDIFIPKGNDTCQPSNYRPISLICKLLERHLYKRILNHMESTMPLALQQSLWGFRFGRSTVSALLDVTHKWLQSLDKGRKICAIYAKRLTQSPSDLY